MTLRQSLVPKIDKDRVSFLKQKIREVEESLETENVANLIEEFAQEIGRYSYDFEYFRDFHSFESIDEFSIKASLPAASKVKDITKEELIWITDRIMEADEFSDYYIELLEQNVPDPRVSDLIFWPSERGYKSELSAEEIVEIALKYNIISG